MWYILITVFILIVTQQATSFSFQRLKRSTYIKSSSSSVSDLDRSGESKTDIEKNVLSDTERKELWKRISRFEKQAVETLSDPSSTPIDHDTALKLFAQSISIKNTDPFISLAHQYASAVERNDLPEMERLFAAMKMVGLPPHVQRLVNRRGKPTSSSLIPSLASKTEITIPNGFIFNPSEPYQMEEVIHEEIFSDTLTDKIRVKIRSHYDESSKWSEGKFNFWYKVSIYNEGAKPIQLLGRNWEVQLCTEDKVLPVRGAGIKGTQPTIQPGDSFSYESMCPLKFTQAPFPPRGKRVLGYLSGTYNACRGNMGQHTFLVKVNRIAFLLPEAAAIEIYGGEPSPPPSNNGEV